MDVGTELQHKEPQHLVRRLVLASGNQGKLAELKPLLAPLGFELITQSSLGISEAPEPFLTFVENALSKARHASQHSGLPALADDAGLCVTAWGGRPGVSTADFCTQFGYPKSDDNNRRALLEQMKAETQRGAALVSTLVAVRHAHDPEPLIAVGRVQGQLTWAPVGEQGFGFDPVLYIESEGKTFAQMTPERKNQLSHRGQAARHMLALMRERWL
jgi:XTP/dITP diphosphohydrolase